MRSAGQPFDCRTLTDWGGIMRYVIAAYIIVAVFVALVSAALTQPTGC
jgi:hypothetical protein